MNGWIVEVLKKNHKRFKPIRMKEGLIEKTVAGPKDATLVSSLRTALNLADNAFSYKDVKSVKASYYSNGKKIKSWERK